MTYTRPGSQSKHHKPGAEFWEMLVDAVCGKYASGLQSKLNDPSGSFQLTTKP